MSTPELVGPVTSACLTCGQAVELVPALDFEWTTGLAWRHTHAGQSHRPRVVTVAVDDRGCRLLEDHNQVRQTIATLATLTGISLAVGAFVGSLIGAAQLVVAWLS